jgi:hypothetical protein
MFFGLLAAWLAGVGPVGAVTVSSPVVQIHWLGLKQIGTETNAVRFMSLWNLPESEKLRAQTLDKLSRWGRAGATNPATAQLRPLLDDLVSAESYLEVRGATNQQMVLALRLPADRARLWETNLAAVLEALTGIHPIAVSGRLGWALKKHHPPDLIELTRAGEWTLIGAATKTNALLADFADRISKNHAPCSTATTNFWLAAELDLPRFISVFHLPPSILNLISSSANLQLTVTGDGEYVVTRGTLDFPTPLGLTLRPWTIPTNVIQEPLLGFTAVRSASARLAASEFWSSNSLGRAPDQLYLWTQSGVPMQTYFAAPSSAASNQVSRLAGYVLDRINPLLAANGPAGAGEFRRAPDGVGLAWNGLPFMSPFLQFTESAAGPVVVGGLFPPDGQTNHPPSPELLRLLATTTNLVVYDWELTGPRVETWLYIGQFFRLAFAQAQLPPESTAVNWLKAIEPQLGNCATLVTQTGSARLTFQRKSALGLTALELQLLADWLESPRFPVGIHTHSAPPDLPFPSDK